MHLHELLGLPDIVINPILWPVPGFVDGREERFFGDPSTMHVQGPLLEFCKVVRSSPFDDNKHAPTPLGSPLHVQPVHGVLSIHLESLPTKRHPDATTGHTAGCVEPIHVGIDMLPAHAIAQLNQIEVRLVHATRGAHVLCRLAMEQAMIELRVAMTSHSIDGHVDQLAAASGMAIVRLFPVQAARPKVNCTTKLGSHPRPEAANFAEADEENTAPFKTLWWDPHPRR